MNPDSAANGKYIQLMQLGRGTQGVVRLAVARGMAGFHKLVVLKTLPDECQGEPELVEQFLSEGRLTANMSHNNIIQTNEAFLRDGLPVLVMDYVEGKAYSDVLTEVARRQAVGEAIEFPTTMRLTLIADVLNGLQYAHNFKGHDGKALNLVHRDVTPDNLLITYDGHTKLLNFGIAKLSTSMVRTATGVIKGKAAYLAPEQLGLSAVDRRADIFAAGVMLWETVAGQRLWGQKAPDTTILRRLLKGDIPAIRDAVPDVPQALEDILGRALASDKEERYSTVAELQADLRAYLKTLPAVTPEEIAGFLSSLFSEERARTQKLVESHLAALTQCESLEVFAPGAGGHVALNPEQRAGARGLTSRWALVVGLCTVASLMGAMLALGLRTTEPASSAAPPVAAVTAPVSEAQFATLDVVVEPKHATVFLDGQEAPVGSPRLRKLERGRVYELRAEAEGYKSRARTILLDKDLALAFELVKLPSAGPASTQPSQSTRRKMRRSSAGLRRAPHQRAAKRASELVVPKPLATLETAGTSAAATPAPDSVPAAAHRIDCTVPFTIELDGTKVFRRECLLADSAKGEFGAGRLD